jgi:hypothetical protein
MALNFPDTPTIGQTFPQPPVSGMPVYTWDGEKWTSAAGGNIGGATILTGDTPPVGAGDNTLWLETDTGILFFKWNDGNSSQWVALASGTSGAVLYSNPQALTVPQKTQARTNIGAAGLEALANQNLIINGGPSISQEYGLGGTGGMVAPGAYYACDGWYVGASWVGSGVVYFGTEANSSPYQFPADIVMSVQAPLPTFSTASFYNIYQFIEGNRWARLGWGGSAAQPISIGFWVSSEQLSGVMTLAIRNAVGTRSYCIPFNVTGGAGGKYVTATIPGCTDGQWQTNNVAAAIISICSFSGTNFIAPAANAWTNGNFVGAPTLTNLHAAPNAIRIWGISVIPGTIPVPQELSPFASMRPYDQELLTCQRYFKQWGGQYAYEKIGTGLVTSATQAYIVLPISVPMRGAPTIVVSAAGDWTVANGSGIFPVTSIAADTLAANAACIGFTVAGGMTGLQPIYVQANNTTSARFKLDVRL